MVSHLERFESSVSSRRQELPNLMRSVAVLLLVFSRLLAALRAAHVRCHTTTNLGVRCLAMLMAKPVSQFPQRAERSQSSFCAASRSHPSRLIKFATPGCHDGLLRNSEETLLIMLVTRLLGSGGVPWPIDAALSLAAKIEEFHSGARVRASFHNGQNCCQVQGAGHIDFD